MYIFDTNILILGEGNRKFKTFLEETYLNRNENIIISVITEGELRSLMQQRQWSVKRQNKLLNTLSQYIIYPVKVQNILEAYAQIDVYSQGKLANMPLPVGMSSRNMGKNDLWIAATTFVTNTTLVTTDKDFLHLDKVFFDVDWVDIEEFRK